MSAYTEALAHARQTEALAQVAGRLGWDQQTVMPRGANAQRSEEMAALEGVLHARRTDPRYGDLLARAEAGCDIEAANLREMRRAYARHTKVPARLAAELARLEPLSQTAWEHAQPRRCRGLPALAGTDGGAAARRRCGHRRGWLCL